MMKQGVVLAATAVAYTYALSCAEDADCGDDSFCRNVLAEAPTPAPTGVPEGCEAEVVKTWGDCRHHPKCCEAGAYCAEAGYEAWGSNVAYRQCKPVPKTPTPPTTAAPAACERTLKTWEKCVGAEHCCEEGAYCHVQSKWWAQCKPAKPTEAPATPPPCAFKVREWGECTGQEHCCDSGLRCNVQSKWYAQCVKDADATPEPTAAPCAGALKVWQGCTGQEHCCEEGTYCHVQSKWWAQCKPIRGTTAAPAPEPVCTSLVNAWQDCTAEPGCCTFGFTCRRQGARATCVRSPEARPCGAERQCVPRAQEGDACGGLESPCSRRVCALGLVCKTDGSLHAEGTCQKA